jgi:hypothetical protein
VVVPLYERLSARSSASRVSRTLVVPEEQEVACFEQVSLP